MRRRFAMLLSIALAFAGVLVVGPSTPAAADVCAGQGTATVTPGLLAPLFPIIAQLPDGSVTISVLQDSFAASSFAFGLSAGACAPGLGGITATGTLRGYCGHSGGAGTDDAGHLFGWISIGGTLLITGEITGAVQATPDPLLAGNSCFTSHTGATSFIVVGAANRINCATNTLNTTDVLMPILSQILLTTTTVAGTTVNLHIGGLGVHVTGHEHVCVGSPL